MRIGIVSSAVPLVAGGYRLIAEWLEAALRERGHSVETLYLPSTDDPDTLIEQMSAFRRIRLDHYYDRVITLRPPAHAVQHPAKIVWFIHHVRMFYDLWGTRYSPFADVPRWRSLRTAVMAADDAALRGARQVFANSRVVSDRLRGFNSVEAPVLYPPVLDPDRFRSGPYGDEIVCVCRMEHHKRQHLLVAALAHTETPVRLRLCGESQDERYVADLRRMADEGGVADRVRIDNRWIGEDEKVALLAGALANAYAAFDEDSYGFPTLEAAHARRCTVTLADAGGVREFVEDGATGLVVPPEPREIAAAFDRLYADRRLAADLGAGAQAQIAALGIGWDRVAERLLS